MSAGSDARWMRLALDLARRGLGRTAPNPAVGAVVVRGGRLLGRGTTGDGGRPHAETVALAEARARYGPDALRGATAYVSLEPCAHHGHTPPCSEALIEAGIARVVCPIEDPDPRVSGRGFARLAAAGLEVDRGFMAAEAREVQAGFLSRLERRRPSLLLKLAATLDGRIATATGESRWITGAEARLRAHLMRAEADAVLVGAGTARADDPMLDVRGLGPVSQPVRVVADGSLTLSLGSRLVVTARAIPVWILHLPDADPARRAAFEAAGVRTIPVQAGADGALDLCRALEALASAGITRAMCEGGGRIAAALLAADLVDRLALFHAGRTIGAEGLPVVGSLGIGALAEAPSFERVSVSEIGADLLSLWRRAH